MGLLAGQTQADARDGIPSRLRYWVSAFVAVSQTRTLSQATLRTADSVLYRCVNLILYRAFARPTGRHVCLADSTVSESREPNIVPERPGCKLDLRASRGNPFKSLIAWVDSPVPGFVCLESSADHGGGATGRSHRNTPADRKSLDERETTAIGRNHASGSCVPLMRFVAK